MIKELTLEKGEHIIKLHAFSYGDRPNAPGDLPEGYYTGSANRDGQRGRGSRFDAVVFDRDEVINAAEDFWSQGLGCSVEPPITVTY